MEALTGPEEGNQPGAVDLVEDGEGRVWLEDGGELEVDLHGHGNAERSVDVEEDVVEVLVRVGRLGEEGVGGGVETVREGDGEGRRHVRVTGLEVEVAWRETEAGPNLRTEAAVTVEGVRTGLVPRHGDSVGGGVSGGLQVHGETHDGDQERELVTETCRQARHLQTALDPGTGIS